MSSLGHQAWSRRLLGSYNCITRHSVRKINCHTRTKEIRKHILCIRENKFTYWFIAESSYVNEEVKSIRHWMVIMTRLSNETEGRQGFLKLCLRGLGYMVKRKLWIWQDTHKILTRYDKICCFNVDYNLQVSFASMKLSSGSKNIFKI